MNVKKRLLSSKGFTLIEVLLVVGIIAVLLAVVIPKGIRVAQNAKYGTVRKNASELKSYAAQWAEKSIGAQDDQNSTATLVDYYASLCGANGAGVADGQQWIATTEPNNWNLGTPPVRDVDNYLTINGRAQNTTAADLPAPTEPEDTVEHLIPAKTSLKNPFNNQVIFRQNNYPEGPSSGGNGPIPGAIALGFAQDVNGFSYFSFSYQGEDSSEFQLPSTDDTDPLIFHESGLASLEQLKNGVLFAHIR